MDDQRIAQEDGLPEDTGTTQETSRTYVAKSNFDELTPEQQECVREHFARFFISVFENA
jgi:hypothetical protein